MTDYTNFKNCFGEIVDLTDWNSFPLEWQEHKGDLWWFYRKCQYHLGYALLYTKYLYPDVDYADQMLRVDKLGIELGKNRHYIDPLYWAGLLYRIEDEIENMC